MIKIDNLKSALDIFKDIKYLRININGRLFPIENIYSIHDSLVLVPDKDQLIANVDLAGAETKVAAYYNNEK